MEALLEKAGRYLPQFNPEKLRSAYAFSAKAHDGQMRKDGVTPYVMHPLAAAMILTELRADEDTLIAALLHDVPEDTTYTLEDIEALFGPQVRFLVEGVTKLSKVHFRNDMELRQVESLKRLFIHLAEDPRIILIKLADRLHNMRTLDAVPDLKKRERIAHETLEIYVPIANVMGIWDLKNPLEDECFRALYPEEYYHLVDELEAHYEAREAMVTAMIASIETLLEEKGVPFVRVEGRTKNLFGIFQKMRMSGKSFQEINDILGIRVVVADVGNCYQALGVLHQKFTPKIGRLKDYIAIPKSNGYQGIHTTVFGLKGRLTEIQIRTEEMHLENEYGVAAHFFYDEKKLGAQAKKPKRQHWIANILSLQREIQDHTEFLKELKLDFFKDRIFVFTPKGDVLDLPQDSTVLDFAYQVHTHIGHQAVSARVNGQWAPLFSPLSSGDVVQVEIDPAGPGPSEDWLSQVKTHVARTRIREFLKQKEGVNEKVFAETEPARVIPAQALAGAHHFLRLEVEDRLGLLGDLGHLLAQLGFNVLRMHSFPVQGSSGLGFMEFEVQSLENKLMDELVKQLYQIQGVRRVIQL